MRNDFSLIVLLFLSICCLSCTNKLFPLCEKLSSTKPSGQNKIGQSLFDVCKERNIKITVLSENIAEFSGSIKQMKWLQNNYHILICDFDQKTTTMGKTEYTNCLAKSEVWIKIVQSKKLDDLMLDETLYCRTCVYNQFCH